MILEIMPLAHRGRIDKKQFSPLYSCNRLVCIMRVPMMVIKTSVYVSLHLNEIDSRSHFAILV